MARDINYIISELVEYGLDKKLIEKEDTAYAVGRIMNLFSLSDFSECKIEEKRPLSDILGDALDYAYENKLIAERSVVYGDLFDTELMGLLVARPSDVISKFYELYKTSPVLATDYFYSLSCDSNYIRRDRIAKDMKWQVSSAYGNIDITVNLSKPEKDPKAIAAAKKLPQSGYPKCALCHENEGYAGTLSKAPRQNLRQIPFDMAGSPWYLQYSPYVYYNEHCIALSGEHTPMKINRDSFAKLLSFVDKFPHYFIGSNADLPIVGGSILSHDHMQGGRYSFAMEHAEIEIPLEFSGFEDIPAGIIHWPLAVIRLRAKDPARLIDLADKILAKWRSYTDTDAGIISESNGEPHNTITPIARKRGSDFELDLALRNNITTDEHPLGVFHPHTEHHNIKKENIGLIEVMGLAVLPSRLKIEIQLMADAIISGTPFDRIPEIEKHKEWFERFSQDYLFTTDNVKDILMNEIGKTFVRVLEDAGVYKTTKDGREAFLRFIAYVNS